MLKKYATPKNILITLGLWLLALILVQGYMLPYFEKITGILVIDLYSDYDAAEAYKMFKDYGEEGRKFYNYIQVVDMLMPLFTGLFLGLLSTRLLVLANFKYPSVGSLTLLLTFFDYLENLGVFLMLRIFPRPFSDTLVNYLLAMHKVKLFFYAIAFAISLFSFVFWLFKKLGKKSSRT